MSKQEFLDRLRKVLSGIPQDEIEERLTFYSEMIDDRMEEGLSEEDAVSELGDIDKLASQITADIPLTKLVKEKITPKKSLKAWEIILLALGSPIWLSLLIAAIAVILSLCASLCAVIISLWAVFGSLVACAFCGIVAGIVFVCVGKVPSGLMMIGAGIVCTGLSIFAFYGCKLATKCFLILINKFVKLIKNSFVKKEKA